MMKDMTTQERIKKARGNLTNLADMIAGVKTGRELNSNRIAQLIMDIYEDELELILLCDDLERCHERKKIDVPEFMLKKMNKKEDA